MADKLDVYSDLRLPLDVAIWCRTRRYNQTAVQIAQNLKQIERTRAQIAALEARLDDEERKLGDAVKRIKHTMETEDHAL